MPYSEQPLLKILPYEGYQDNETVVALCAAMDKEYYDVATLLEGLAANLNPDTAPSTYLDLLAYLVGLSGLYYDIGWNDTVKRAMIKNAYDLWRLKGTQWSIETVLAIQGITYDLWLRKPLTLPFTMPGKFEGSNLKCFIRLPLSSARTSREWVEANRTLKNYKPAVVDGRVCYQGFKLGYSKLGEPLFT